jgi:hypothetical protein
MRETHWQVTLTAFLLMMVSHARHPAAVDHSYCHVGKWDAPPLKVPLDGGADSPKLSAGGIVDGPISGNGDFGLVVGTNEHTPTANLGSWLLMYVDTMHFRDVQNDVGAVGARDESGGKRGVGYLRVGPAASAKAKATTMRQDITNATVHTAQAFGAYTLRTLSFVSATENVMVTTLWCEGGPCKIAFESSPLALDTAKLKYIIRQSQGRAGPSAPQKSQWFNRSLGDGWAGDNGCHPRAIVREHVHRTAVATAFAGVDASQITISATSPSGHVLALQAGQEATAITALASNREFLFANDADPDEPLKFVGQKLQRFVQPSELASLTSAHNQWWTRYWKEKSGVQLGLDPDGTLSAAERFWYGTMYTLAVTNRVNYTTHTPPTGLWHNFYTANTQGWPGYTTDINMQSLYFGAAAANHAETELAMIDLLDQFIRMGQRISALAFNCSMNGDRGGGVLLPVEIGAYGATKTWSDQGLRSNGALMAMVHIVHARWTGEVGGQIYRYVKEVGAFWECFLVKTEDSGGGYVYNDINDCPYETCAADHYAAGIGTRFMTPHNPPNSLAFVLTLFEALIDFSEVLGVDEELRPKWKDIIEHLAPFPWRTAPDGSKIFVDWDGAQLPPKQNNQMSAVIQLVYPGSRVSSSSVNRTLFRMAKATMDFVDNWVVRPDGSDADCALFQISMRLNYNQTQMYPAFVKQLGPNSPWGLLENGLVQGLVQHGAAEYVNELLVRSDEPFVRFFPGHFSSIAPAQHGLPLPLPDTASASAESAANTCDITGVWYDTHNAGRMNNSFELQKTSSSTWHISQPNEWHRDVFVNVSVTPATPGVPGEPRVANHPECGVRMPSTPARAAQSGFGFLWPPTKLSRVAYQQMTPTADCQNLCFADPRAAAQNSGMPFSRSNATPAAGACAGATPAAGVARPWLNSSFSGLRVKGAQGTEACPLANGLCTFVVGASLSARGEAGAISVRSERGGRFTFLSPFPSGVAPQIEELGGGNVPCMPWKPAKALFFLEPHETVFIFPTKANGTYSISS